MNAYSVTSTTFYLKILMFCVFFASSIKQMEIGEVLFELSNQTTDLIVVVDTLHWRCSSFDFCPYLFLTWNKFSSITFFKIWALPWLWGMRYKIMKTTKNDPYLSVFGFSELGHWVRMLLFLCQNEDICMEFKYASKDQFHKGNIVPPICMCRKF
jgi:hypothetical protein